MEKNRRRRTRGIFPESRVAHRWIDPIEEAGGRGVEFGPAAHNSFGFRNCVFADREVPSEGAACGKGSMSPLPPLAAVRSW